MKPIDKLFLWLSKEPTVKDESIYQIATLRIRTTEPKRPSCYLAWVRWQQRFNKTIIQL